MPRYIEDRGYFLEMPDDIPEEDDTNYLGDFKSYVTSKIEEARMSVGDALERGDQADQKYGEGIKGDLNQFTDYVNTQFQDLNSGDEQKALGAMDEMASFFGPGDNGAQGAVAGIFIGPKGRKNLYGPNYNEARNQERISKELKSGKDPVEAKDRLWQKYGIEQFADKGIRSEISDSTAELNPNIQEYLKGLKETTGSKVIRSTERLGKVLQDHPDLFKAYPSLKDVRVKIQYGTRRDDVRGSYDFNWDTIELNSDDFEEMRSTLLHEIQHRIQFEEGWGLGNNSDKLKQRLTSELNKEYKTVDKRLQEIEQANPEGYLKDPEYAFFEKQAMRLKGYENAIGTSPQTDYEIYQRYWGEAEARNVQRRDIESRTDDMFQERIRPGKSSDVRPKNAIYQLHPEGPVDFPERP